MPNTQIIMFQTQDGQTKIDVRMENETVWLSLDQIAELFQRDKSTISRHIKNVLAEGELDENATVAKFATVQKNPPLLLLLYKAIVGYEGFTHGNTHEAPLPRSRRCQKGAHT